MIISTDTVARPLVRNSSQFNGEFVCDFCLHPGVRVPKGDGNVRVCPQPKSCPTFKPRSMEQHKKDLELVGMLKNKAIHGIVGPNPFQKLADFDHVEAYAPEYMHSCCLGVFKMFLKIWTDKTHKAEKWYIGHYLAVINARLSQAKPPYDISRTIDSLTNWSDRKASMYRAFALYYFHLLEGILPSPFLNIFLALYRGYLCCYKNVSMWLMFPKWKLCSISLLLTQKSFMESNTLASMCIFLLTYQIV